jgi:hypothetical protein
MSLFLNASLIPNMNPESQSSEPKSEITRRDALMRALKGSVAAAAIAPAITRASTAPTLPEPEFVPENDYPFFGGELPLEHR